MFWFGYKDNKFSPQKSSGFMLSLGNFQVALCEINAVVLTVRDSVGLAAWLHLGIAPKLMP